MTEERDQQVGELWGSADFDFPDGMKNPTADRVMRSDQTWSDTNLATDFDDLVGIPRLVGMTFDRLVCRACGGKTFEVLQTGSWETSARCPCGYYYIVHSG